MNIYQTYFLLGKILALDVNPQPEEIIQVLQKDDIPWEQFVALADQHLILQALFPKIQDHKLDEFFPGEVLKHLKYIFDLTTTRNLEVIKQTEKLTVVLSKEGISPLYMKGVGNILDGVYKYPGERILHDIDLLVPEEKFEDAAKILISDGYRSNYNYNPAQKNQSRHYPILFKPGEPVYAELHRMPVGRKYSKYFNTEMTMQAAKRITFYPGCLVMSDEHKIIHNFIHGQMDHRSRIYAREFMRNLYDLLLLSGRADPEKVLSDFGHFRRTSSGYLDITYDTFAITPTNRINPPLFFHAYRFRYFLNIRYPFVGMMSLLLIRLFSGYVVKPLRAITDKELRMNLISKLGSRGWYKKQGRFYRKVFGFRERNG